MNNQSKLKKSLGFLVLVMVGLGGIGTVSQAKPGCADSSFK